MAKKCDAYEILDTQKVHWIRSKILVKPDVQLCSVDGAPDTRAGNIKMLTSACIFRQSTVLFIKDCTVHV